MCQSQFYSFKKLGEFVCLVIQVKFVSLQHFLSIFFFKENAVT